MKLASSALILLLMLSLLPLNAHADTINYVVYTDKSSYLNTDTINLTYMAFNSGGHVIDGGAGLWFLNSSQNGSCVANGTLVGSHGFTHIPLYRYNLSTIGSGAPFTIQTIFKYKGNTKKAEIDITITDSRFLVFSMSAIPDSQNFYPGSLVKVRISSPVPSENINFLKITHNGAIWKNITSLHIGVSGTIEYSFIIPDTWKSGDSVTITAEIANSTENTGFTVATFHNIYMKVSPGNTVLSGETIHIEVNYSNITNPYFHFYIVADGVVIKRFFTSTNNFTYTIPRNYSGYMDIQCSVFNSTAHIYDLDYVLNVKVGILTLYSDRTTYHAGESIHLFATLKSNVMKNSTYIFSIYTMNRGNFHLERRVITENPQITIEVQENAPERYLITVTAYSEQHTVETALQLKYSTPIIISSHVLTESVYSTGAFVPGEQIELSYTVSGLSGPGFMYYGFGNEYFTSPHIMKINGNSSGHISIKIPENTQTGYYSIHISVVSKDGKSEITVPLFVDAHPPWSQYMILSIPAADFITLVIVLATVTSGIVYIKYGKKTKEKSSESTKESL